MKSLLKTHGRIRWIPGSHKHLMFEITESSEIKDLEKVDGYIQNLRKKGIKFALMISAQEQHRSNIFTNSMSMVSRLMVLMSGQFWHRPEMPPWSKTWYKCEWNGRLCCCWNDRNTRTKSLSRQHRRRQRPRLAILAKQKINLCRLKSDEQLLHIMFAAPPWTHHNIGCRCTILPPEHCQQRHWSSETHPFIHACLLTLQGKFHTWFLRHKIRRKIYSGLRRSRKNTRPR